MGESSDLKIGDLFAERYVLEKIAGKGGMGIVYAATDTLLSNQKIALKLLHQTLSTDSRYYKRFLREVELTRQVNHPNIVRTFDVGIHNKRLFFTMEFVEGISLSKKLKKDYFSPQETTRIICQICEGLSAIHKAHIIHRDLTPANIMLLTSGEIKIADFGVAKPKLSNITASHEVIGNSAYIPPEVWKGDNIDLSSDIYSLGIVAYQMLTGIRPFEAKSSAEYMFKHLETKIVPLCQITEGIPLWLDELVVQMLNKNPRKRPPSAQKIRELIENKETEAAHDNNDNYLCEPADYLAAPLVYNPGANNDPAKIDPLLAIGPTSQLGHLETPVGSLTGGIEQHQKTQKNQTPEDHKESLDSAAYEEPSFFEILQRIMSAVMVILISGLLILIMLHGPASIIWNHISTEKDSSGYLFLGLGLVISLNSLLTSIVFFLLSSFKHSVKKSLGIWMKAAFFMAASQIFLIIVNIVRLGYAWSKYFSYPTVLEQISSGAASSLPLAVNNVLKASLLIPTTEFYSIDLPSTGPQFVLESHPFPVIAAIHGILVVAVLFLYVCLLSDKKYDSSESYIQASQNHIPLLLTVMIPLFILQFVLAESGFTFLERTFNLGAFSYQISGFELLCGITNLFLVTLFIQPFPAEREQLEEVLDPALD